MLWAVNSDWHSISCFQGQREIYFRQRDCLQVYQRPKEYVI